MATAVANNAAKKAEIRVLRHYRVCRMYTVCIASISSVAVCLIMLGLQCVGRVADMTRYFTT